MNRQKHLDAKLKRKHKCISCGKPSTINDWARANSGLAKVNQIKSIPLHSLMPEGRSIFLTRREIKMKGSQRSSIELNLVYQTTPTNVCLLIYPFWWQQNRWHTHRVHTHERSVCLFSFCSFNFFSSYKSFRKFWTIKTLNEENPITCFSPQKRLAHGKSFVNSIQQNTI